MVKEIGKYNINYLGDMYDGNILYEMVNIEEFDGDKPVEGGRKTLYFRKDDRRFIIPEFRNEKEVESWLWYQNNARLQVYSKIFVEEIR